ncbi:N-acetylglucosamine-1-phosphotransferase subunits alpha/beta-like [Oppia nitens]|uniref:N-acetylglucosamine-1-phosphotransferase subunits alpha/beta-like n=1 Tax=Oppia nitens TaxID=1686743 RepID=UPI0023D9B107|nr:N-acetylglucosamine-1-phosphotransferase subunits alpha/beta-like [Oppia nitens]
MAIHLCKIIQRRLYDLFSSKQSLLLCFAFFCMTFIATLHIIEIFLVWNHKTDSLIRGTGDEYHQSCYDFPIDLVYTWVNGSDPKLLAQLLKTKQQIQSTFLRHGNCGNNDCKASNSTDINCIDGHCLVTPIVYISAKLTNPYHLFGDNVTKVEIINTLSGTLLYFATLDKAYEVTERCFISDNMTTYSVRKSLIILDKSIVNNETTGALNNDTNGNKNSSFSLKVNSLILVSGIPVNATTNRSQLVFYLSPIARKQVDVINIYKDKHMALLSLKSSATNVTKVINALHMSFRTATNGIDTSIKVEHPIHLRVVDTTDRYNISNQTTDKTLVELNDNRFSDNQELRYSLRSVEKYANWVRNVFIVTNGQIPNWINLNNPRIKIITHEEIFPNISHLPSFSSPAIETHLHRIPGLSKRFLYLNDDFFFGGHIYPEDFYTNSKGFKIYLSWPVPNCVDGCPLNWLKDGYCDQACNKSECLWDGGDCLKDSSTTQRSDVYSYTDSSMSYSDVYCSASCVDSWLSDRFCDQICNNINCGYDLGDCGTDMFENIFNFYFKPKQNAYNLSNDINVFYFNLSDFLLLNNKNSDSFQINELSYENNSFVRSAALNMIHKVLTFVLIPNRQKHDLNIALKGQKNKSEFVINFQLLLTNDSKLQNTSDFSIDKNINNSGSDDNETEMLVMVTHLNDSYLGDRHTISDILSDNNNKNNTTIIINNNNENTTEFKFKNRLPEYPKILPLNEMLYINNISLECDFNVSELPDDIKEKFNDFDIKFKNGILTENGFKNFRTQLIQLYVKQICNYKTTIKLYDRTMSFLDWERQSTFADIETGLSLEENVDKNRVLRRHLMDSYADSLKHVNYLYNKVFGIEMRKVPAHMAHFIDVDIMDRLQNTFRHHFEITSSHKIRSSDDMQFAFAYNYYLMSETRDVNLTQVFNDFDVDHSGSWSISEIRTVIINIYELPLKWESMDQFYKMLFSCCNSSDYLCSEVQNNANLSQYYYYREESPLLLPVHELPKQSIVFPMSLVMDCVNVTNKLRKLYEKKQKYNKFEILGEEDVTFKMIRSNATIVGQELDELRKHVKKFMCLNDNIDDHNSDGKHNNISQIKQMLVDFYESIFPMRSQFELPLGQTNRFTCIHDYSQWKHKQNSSSQFMSSNIWIIVIVFALILTIISKEITFL